MSASRMSKLKYILILPLSTYVIFYILSAIFTAPILDSGQLKQPAELALVGAIDRGETIKPLGVAEHLSLLKKKPSDKSLRLRKKKLDQELKKLLPTVSGWGEDGKGVHLTSAADKEKAAKVFKEGAYNVYVSDRISPNRTLRSVVSKECNALEYNVDELPNVSVIIIFTDEIFSALVRTIWSVINRTHKRLLREIILVDDFSEHGYLQATLRDYIDIYLNTVPGYEHAHGELIKLVRLPKRSGLIQARLKGARMARGDVLLFLDSHCEATDRWIEPLVQRIKENNKVFVCPVIDIIEDKSLEYQSAGPYYFQIGGFDWNGNFNWIKRNLASNGDERDPTKPVKSPTMAGGLFAVDRKFFFEVGSYDEDMQIWGGENLEMSFRVWQCGGRIEIHPCSHVGHIFRDFHPYSFNGIDSYGHNTLRAVHVWMDEFARYFLMLHPELHDRKYGDISSRLELRKQLKCKSFKWYLDHVYDKRKFVYDKNVLAYGWVKNKASDLCIDVLNRQETSDLPAGLYTCEHMNHPLEAITNQLFSYSRHREIRREEGCLTISDEKAEPKAEDDDIDHLSYAKTINSAASGTSVFHKVLLSPCEEPDYVSDSDHETSLTKFKEQIWRHESVHPRSNPNRLIVSESTGECLTTSGAHGNTDLLATKCDKSDPRQYWEFQIYANE